MILESTLLILFFNLGLSTKYHNVKNRTSKNNIIVINNQKKCLLKNRKKSVPISEKSLYERYMLFNIVKICHVNHIIIKGAKNIFTIQASIDIFSSVFILYFIFIIFFFI